MERKKYWRDQLIVGLVYGLVVFGLRGVRWPLEWEMARWVWWFVGVWVGMGLLFLDRLVYVYSYPEEQLSKTVLYHWLQKNYKRAVVVLSLRRDEQNKLSFRSVLFMAVWVLLSFFALTSTVGLFGKGVVMGLMLHILLDMWRLHLKDKQKLNERLFWQIKRKVSLEEQLVVMYVITGLFGVFSLWVR